MNRKTAFVALLSALLLAPAAHAQVTVSGDEDLTAVEPEGAATIGFTASLPCGDMVPGAVSGGGSQSETISLTYPDGIAGPETVTVSFPGTPCVTAPTGSSTATGSIDVTALPEARGMTRLNIVAEHDGSSAGELPVQVGYRSGHSFITDVEFPLEIGGDPVSWNATLTVTANADTMVMTLEDEGATYGSLAGLFAFKNFRDIPPEGASEQLTFTYTPSGSNWETDTTSFRLWSHYIEDGSMKTADDVITWEFVNTQSATEEESKGSPGFEAVAILAMVGAAAVLARRRA